ncbi:MAG: PEP-CTERM sorting domain-containing protein [Armatimonadota bacterium]|nr:PEP-CTERM sorting domain-containing protein [bacterium]
MVKSLRIKTGLVVASLVLLALSAVGAYAVTVPDGSFENLTVGASGNNDFLPDWAWIVGAGNTGLATIVSGGVNGNNCLKFDRTICPTPENWSTVIYTSPYPWCNPVVGTPGQKYEVSFWAYGTGTLNFQSVSWYTLDNQNVICNGNEILDGSSDTLQNYNLTNQWTKYSATFTAKAGTQVESLSFRILNVGTYYLDNVTMTAVPEPGSMLAMLSGFAGLVGFGIRRRK